MLVVALAAAFDGRIAARLCARLTQHERRRQIRHQRIEAARRRREHTPIAVDDGRVLQAELVTHAQQRERSPLVAARRKVVGHELRLGAEVRQTVVEDGASEFEAGVERRLDAHVEPRLDAARDELQRHQIDDAARQHPHQREEDGQLGEKSRAEASLAQPRKNDPDERTDDEDEDDRHRDVRRVEQRIVAIEEFGIGRCQRKQAEQPDGHERHRDDQRANDDALEQAAAVT